MTKILKSKKALAAIIFVVLYVGSLIILHLTGIEIDEATIQNLAVVVAAYIVGQGLADFGKEKIEEISTVVNPNLTTTLEEKKDE